MRGLLVLLGMLVAAGSAGAGMIIPEPVSAQHPHWLVDGRHVELDYALAPQGVAVRAAPYVVADDGTELRPATADDVEAHPDFATHDGRTASIDPYGDLGVDGRAIVSDGNAYPYAWQPIAWSPDGTRIAFTYGGITGADSIEVDVIPAAGGKRHRVAYGTSVAWIDDHTLAVGREGYATDIDRVDLRTGRTTRLVSGYYSPGGIDISPDGSQIAFTVYAGAGYDRGSVVYVASTHGADRALRRVTPGTCTVKPSLYFSAGRCIDGTDGRDLLVGTRAGDVMIGGAGADDIRAGQGPNTIYGQWGGDAIRAGNDADRIFGGAGSDTIRSGGGSDTIDGGPGPDVIVSGRGGDYVAVNDGERDVVDCGPGSDEVKADRLDVLRHCELVTRASADPEQGGG